MSLKYSILGLLHYQPMHGYRIKEHIEQNFGHMWSINYGQIYPNLKKMKDEALISMNEEICQGEKGPPRKLYTITDKGRAEFQRWLAESPERGMLLRDPFLMRFVFFDFGEDERSLELVDEQIQSWENQLARRYANLARWEGAGVYVRLMAELGVKTNEVLLAWLKEARQEIAAEAGLESRENVTAFLKTE
ncbi:MAG: PadR family transcriptional regulator [Desulfobacterales bacterium]|nr:PadR family transcriptional regulator [Desulfobacterales bacterium]